MIRHAVIHRLRDENAAGIGHAFEPRRDVDAVAVDLGSVESDSMAS
jgi:hypothetical protein